jgi:hypothetical protein
MIRRALAMVCVGLFLSTGAGCFGSFSTTRNVYNWNRNVSNDKWVRWLVFLVIAIIPIYGIATLIDVIFSNSVEFWTGRNPMAYAPGTIKHVKGENGESAKMTFNADKSIDVVVSKPGEPDREFKLVREDAAVSAYDQDGKLLGRVKDGLDGRPALLATP